MIKAITTVRLTKSREQWQQLSDIFDALGFERGKGWDNEKSVGQPFNAPVGALEFVFGAEPAEPEILIEVSDLDDVRKIVQAKGASAAGEIKESHWDSRYFVFGPAPEIRVGFWEWNDSARKQRAALEGDLIATGMRFAVVAARWNAFITERLLQGALDALRRAGASSRDIDVIRVPGAYEIPSAARTAAETRRYGAIVTIGCLIRGETSHYEHIATEVTRGIGQSAQETGVPHSYGVITVENLEQAIDRAGLKAGNKGFEAGLAAVEMASLAKKIRAGQK